MRSKRTIAARVALAAALAWLAAATALGHARVLAHGADTLVDVQPSEARPGEIVWLLGHGLGEAATIEVRFAYEGDGVPVANVQTGPDGDFALAMLLPRDLRGGEYRVQAWVDGAVVGATLHVGGPAVTDPAPDVGTQPVSVVVPAAWTGPAGTEPPWLVGAVAVLLAIAGAGTLLGRSRFRAVGARQAASSTAAPSSAGVKASNRKRDGAPGS